MHKVRVNAGYHGISLPDGFVYDGEIEVLLTDAQFTAIPAAAFVGSTPILTHLGAVANRSADFPSADLGAVPIPESQIGKGLARYSHSFGLIPGVMCSPGQEWPNLLHTRLGSVGDLKGNATSGAVTAKGAEHMTSNTKPGFGMTPPLDGGLVVIEYSGADYRWTNTTTQLESLAQAVRTMLAYASAQLVVPVTDAWSVGSASLNEAIWFGGSLRYTTDASATLTFTVDGTKCLGGVCYLLTPIEDSATNTLSVRVNGGAPITFDKTGKGAQHQDSFTKGVIKLTGVPTTGTPTVVVSTTAGGPASIEAVIYPAAIPPTILVVEDPPLKTSDQAVATASKPTIDARINAVVAEFSNAYSVDLGQGGWWDPDLHLGSDLNHPNDLGMAAITNRLAQVVAVRVG